MNCYRRQIKTALRDTRPGTPSAELLLERLNAEHREIENAIRRLQNIQRLRERRLSRLGTLDLSETVSKAETIRKVPKQA